MSAIVAFKLLNGVEIIGKHVTDKPSSDFIDNEDVIYLDDATFIAVEQSRNDDGTIAANVVFPPISMLADISGERQHMPFALYRNTILGQFKLKPALEKMYREYATGLVLLS